MKFRIHLLTHRLVSLAFLGAVALGSAVAADRLRFEYAIEVAADRASDGVRRVQTDDLILRNGDRFRVTFVSKFDAFVYLFARGDAEGSYTRLFPHEGIEASNLVRPNFEVRVPDQNGWMTLDDQPGMERLMLVISNRPQPDLEETGTEVGMDRLNRLVAQLYQGRSPGNVRVSRQKDGWTTVTFQGRPQRILHVANMIITHHSR